LDNSNVGHDYPIEDMNKMMKRDIPVVEKEIIEEYIDELNFTSVVSRGHEKLLKAGPSHITLTTSYAPKHTHANGAFSF